MSFELTWLAETLEDAGLKVAEVIGWRARGRGPMGKVLGVMCHHTATVATGNMPTLGVLTNGRPASPGTPALAGPLAHLGLGRDGAFYVVAAGRCNHAGAGSWQGVTTGNASFIGIEAENSGRPDDPWPEVQMEAYARGVAALLKRLGAGSGMCCGHKEYALPQGRKIDPSFPMPPFRARVDGYLLGKTPPAPIPAKDPQQRPTLRRGIDGPDVAVAQRSLGLAPTGDFDAETESAVRAWQRTNALVPDGIIGPKSWAILASAPAAVAPAPAAEHAGPAAAQPADLPPVDDAAHPVRVIGRQAVSPDGKAFARIMRRGFVTLGDTPLGTWLAKSSPNLALTPSVIRVLGAISLNEGRLEAINSWDDAHLSFGLFQWTAGAGTADGELAALLDRLKRLDDAAFAECFGRYGLDVKVVSGKTTGQILLDGKVLASDAEKDVLRDANWAYRFWRAGHDPSVRKAQAMHAAGRISQFINLKAAGIPVARWLTSEHGIALVLDEHVNRPKHVPGTLQRAVLQMETGRLPDPAAWQDADEAKLIATYLALRTGTMTDSQKRAATMAACVAKGTLSARRGSFILT